MPQMLREIIRRSLSREPRFEIVGEYPRDVAIDVAIDRSMADYVIVSADVFDAHSLDQRLLDGQQVRVLAVRPDGGQATLHQLRPEHLDLGELSPERLLAVMRP
jgi:hypothetical protein